MELELNAATAYTLTNMVTGKAAGVNMGRWENVIACDLHGGLDQQVRAYLNLFLYFQTDENICARDFP
ncbi:hypothetical protein DL93DRAFT_2092353, partial [Clavulina sp. PMI_390]